MLPSVSYVYFLTFRTDAVAPRFARSAISNRWMNFLFLFPDQQRADWLGGTPGLPLRTPSLDELRRRGTQFTRAICPSPLCAPSRACLATGREYERCGVRNNRDDLPAGTTTFYQRLREAG